MEEEIAIIKGSSRIMVQGVSLETPILSLCSDVDKSESFALYHAFALCHSERSEESPVERIEGIIFLIVVIIFLYVQII